MSSILYILVIIGCVLGARAQQSGTYGCRNDGTGYRIEFQLSAGGETIRSVYGGSPETANCSTGADPVDGLFKLNVPVVTVGSADPKQVACGVTQDPNIFGDYIMIVTTRSLVLGYKATDRRYMLRCHFNGPMEIIVRTPEPMDFTGDMSQIAMAASNALASVLNLNLKRAADGQPTDTVAFLDSVYLEVILEQNYHNSQSWMLKDCIATTNDGIEVSLIDSQGCADAGTGILPAGVAFSGNISSMRTDNFQMFLIPGSTNVVIQCVAVVCPDLTCIANCAKRRRRQATENESGNVIAIIKITDRINGTQSIKLTSPENNETCTNWPYLVAIAALALVLLVTLGFAMLLFMNKTHANRVTDVKAVA